MERKLASVQRIIDIKPIPNADAIEVATVKGWKLVVKKNEFQIGDKAIYFEIDSYLPIIPEFEFLRASSYTKMGELEGFRLRTVKMRGQISQGLLAPLSILSGKLQGLNDIQVGYDVTDLLGVLKYERPIPIEMLGKMRGGFPSVIPSTSLERIQNLYDEYPEMKEDTYFETEKLDGESTTFYLIDGMFSICSRDVDLLETPENLMWKLARELDIENRMRALGFNVALQAEFIGEGIKKNKYKISGKAFKFFKAFDVDKYEYFNKQQFQDLIGKMGLQTVPIIDGNFKLPDSIDDLLAHAEGHSLLNSNTKREGLVIYSNDMKRQFKVIANSLLLKEN